MNYYLLLNGIQEGPFTLRQLRSMWDQGRITLETMYWQEGMTDWEFLSSIVSQFESIPLFLPENISPTESLRHSFLKQKLHLFTSRPFIFLIIVLIGAGYIWYNYEQQKASFYAAISNFASRGEKINWKIEGECDYGEFHSAYEQLKEDYDSSHILHAYSSDSSGRYLDAIKKSINGWNLTERALSIRNDMNLGMKPDTRQLVSLKMAIDDLNDEKLTKDLKNVNYYFDDLTRQILVQYAQLGGAHASTGISKIRSLFSSDKYEPKQ